MPFGLEVGLGSGHIVLDGDQLPPRGYVSVLSILLKLGIGIGVACTIVNNPDEQLPY